MGYLKRDCVTGLGGENLVSSTDPEMPLCVAVEKSKLVTMLTDWGLASVSPEDFVTDDNSKIIFECLQQDPSDEAESLLWKALEQRGAGIYDSAIEDL